MKMKIDLTHGDEPRMFTTYSGDKSQTELIVNTGHEDADVSVWLPNPNGDSPLYDKPVIAVQVDEWGDSAAKMKPKEAEALAFALMRAASYVRQYNKIVKEAS